MKEKQKNSKPMRFAILATDVLLFSFVDNELLVRLIRVDRKPYFKNILAFPGGLIRPTEAAEEAAIRIMRAKAGLDEKSVYLEQLFTFSDIDRDPRGRVVAVAYLGCVRWEDLNIKQRSNSAEAEWLPISKIGRLAYDHNKMLKTAHERLTSKVTYSTIISKLISKEFTLTELESAIEIITGKNIDKRNFRKKILRLDVVIKTKHKKTGLKSRPAQLYKFRKNSVSNIEII